MNQNEIKKVSEEFDYDVYVKYLLQKNIDEFLHGIVSEELCPLTSKIVEHISMPPLGSHLVTPRVVYTHHGIYIGDGKVVEYAGFNNGIGNVNDVIPVDSSKQSPVQIVSLVQFEKGKSYTIKKHPHATYSPQDIAKRAYKRVGETNYNLIFNNCEDFANHCIYGVNFSSQTRNVATVISKKASTIYHSGKALKAYIDGKISKEKLYDEISYTATQATMTSFYAGFGQVVIPIPVLGAFAGAAVGYYLGAYLYNSHHFSIIGDSPAVKESKERREKVERICNIVIPIIRQSRIQLQLYINEYFSERKSLFDESFSRLENAIANNDVEMAAQSLEKINRAFEKELTNKSFDAFDKFMRS